MNERPRSRPSGSSSDLTASSAAPLSQITSDPIPRLLQIEDFAVSSVTKRDSLAHLRSMSNRRRTTIRRIPPSRCARCAAALPRPATTGRPRVYCGPGCRKAAYDDRRARKPEAFQVRVVERTVVETVETISTIDEGHDIIECVRRVCGSPRAVTNVFSALSGLVRSRTLRLDGRWAPAVRALAQLNSAIRDSSERDPWRHGR